MNRNKLEEITRIINREAQPTATEDDVWAFISGTPHNFGGDWLETASPDEIASWIIEQIFEQMWDEYWLEVWEGEE